MTGSASAEIIAENRHGEIRCFVSSKRTGFARVAPGPWVSSAVI